MDTKGGKRQGCGGGMNWETAFDMYTLICIKWITNKDLLYKKIKKIKFKNSTTTKKNKENISKKKKKEWTNYTKFQGKF